MALSDSRPRSKIRIWRLSISISPARVNSRMTRLNTSGTVPSRAAHSVRLNHRWRGITSSWGCSRSSLASLDSTVRSERSTVRSTRLIKRSVIFSMICKAVCGCENRICSSAWRGINQIPASSSAIAVAGFGLLAKTPNSLNISPGPRNHSTCSRPSRAARITFSQPYCR